MFLSSFHRFTLMGLYVCGFSVVQAEEVVRDWTDNKGRKISAKMVGVQGDDKVLVFFKGRERAMPLAILSDADKEYVAAWKKKQEERGDSC